MVRTGFHAIQSILDVVLHSEDLGTPGIFLSSLIMIARNRYVIRLAIIHNFRLIDFFLGQQCFSLLILFKQKRGL